MGVPVSQFYSGENIIACPTYILIDETCNFTQESYYAERHWCMNIYMSHFNEK